MVKNTLKFLTALVLFINISSPIYAQAQQPVFTSTPNYYTTVGQIYTYTPVVNATSGVTLKIVTNPGWLSILRNTTVSGTPQNSGTFNVSIAATDQNGLTGYQYYNIIVSNPAPTPTPTPTSIPTATPTPTPTIAPTKVPASSVSITVTVPKTTVTPTPSPTTTVNDVNVPLITSVTPNGDITNKRPQISISYTAGNGIDLTSVRLYLDKTDITSKSIVTANNVSYTPTSDLKIGSHSLSISLTAIGAQGKTITSNFKFNLVNGSNIFNSIGSFVHNNGITIARYLLFAILILLLIIIIASIGAAIVRRNSTSDETGQQQE